MDMLNRIRRAGGLLGVVLAAGACGDGFFFEPATSRATPVRVHYTLTDGTAGSSAPEAVPGPEGVEGPQASAGTAFDKADGAVVIVRSEDGKTLFNQRLALEAAGTDKKVAFNLDLPAGGTTHVTLEMKLMRGQDALFEGYASADLSPGQAAEVTVLLMSVLAKVEAGGPYFIRILGGTAKVTAVGLFATGDSTAVSATYRGLDSNISVASDGTVTGLANGDARVEASRLGQADTAVVTVDDRCVPRTLPAFGTPASGVLDDLDCPLPSSDRVGDWYRFQLTQPMTVKFSLSSPDYVPRWWLYQETGPGRGFDFQGFGRAHQLDGDPGFEAVALPPGTYRIYLYAGGVAARPRGRYTLATQVVTEDNDFACPAADGEGTLWITPGYKGDQDLGGGCAGTDPLKPVNQDRYGVYLEPGVEYVFRTSTPGGLSPEIVLAYHAAQVAEAVGSSLAYYELRYKTPADRPGWHTLTVSAAPGGATGPYYLTFMEAAKDQDWCAATGITLLGTHTGGLDYRRQCYFKGLYASEYRTFTLTQETTFRGDLTAAKPTSWGIVEATGNPDTRFRYATGSDSASAVTTLPAGSYALFVSATPGNLGTWSLTATAVSKDLDVGCAVDVHVVPGFYGRQTLNSACVGAGGKNRDAYRIYLSGGQQYSVAVVGGTLQTSLAVFGSSGEVAPSGEPVPSATAPEAVIGPAAANLLTFTAPATDWYRLLITGASVGAEGKYAIHVTRGGPNAGGSLSGTVTTDGKPLAGVTVTLSGSAARSVQTDAAGKYAFTGLTMGVYGLAVSGVPANVVMTSTTASVTLDGPDMAQVQDFAGRTVTTGSGVIQGKVDHSGIALEGVTVTLSGASSATTTTDASGNYTFTSLVDGSYSVTVSGFFAAAYSFSSRTLATTVTGGGTATVNFTGAHGGEPSFSVNVVVSSDPNGHEPFIQETTVKAFQADVYGGGHVSIWSSVGGTKWVLVAGTVKPDGSFALTGQGTVAGYPNVDVLFSGRFTYDSTRITGVTGTLTMGQGTQLPPNASGQYNPAIYAVTATRVP